MRLYNHVQKRYTNLETASIAGVQAGLRARRANNRNVSRAGPQILRVRRAGSFFRHLPACRWHETGRTASGRAAKKPPAPYVGSVNRKRLPAPNWLSTHS